MKTAIHVSVKATVAVFMSVVLVLATCAVIPTLSWAASKPAKVKISSVKSKSVGKMTVKVKKAKRAKGYQYKIGTNKKVTKNTYTYTTSAKSVTYSGLTKGIKYYVKVRAYSKSGSSKKWGKWSSVKSVKIKGGATPASQTTSTKTVAGVSVDSPYAKFYSSSATELKEGIQVDYSMSKYGYVGIKGTKGEGKYAGNKLKVQIKKSSTYSYDLKNNGDACFYPLNMGDGTYKVQVYRNTSGNSYSDRGSASFSAKMMNAYQPYMHNNWYVDYDSGSSCVKKAASLCSGKKGDTAYVSAIYAYLTKTIKYDYNKAKNVKSGYTPNPDSTLSSKKGICFDYASLAAAMMRSKGIPCRVITGYVSGDVYHAWNMIYLKNQGWITSEIKAQNNQWGRIDVTFAATGADATFIGNGKNYSTPRYIY